jgi:cytochrome c553
VRGVRSLSVLVGVSVLAVLACSTGIRSAGGSITGSEMCSGCHAADFASWKDSYHSKMVRTPREGLLQDAADHWVRDTKGAAGPTHGNVDGRSYALDDVVLVVSSKWKQRYLVKNPANGNHQFLDKQWNAYTGRWEGYGNNKEWNAAICNTTGDRLAAYLAANPGARKARSPEKDCETCHGPGTSSGVRVRVTVVSQQQDPARGTFPR